MSKRFSILLSVAILFLGSQFFSCTNSSTSTPNNTSAKASTSTSESAASSAVQKALNEYTLGLTEKILPGDQPVDIRQAELVSLKASIASLKRLNSPKAIANIRKLFHTANDKTARELAGWWLADYYLQEGDLDNTKATLGTMQSNTEYASSTKAKEFLAKL